MRKLFIASLLTAATLCTPPSSQAQTAKDIVKKVIEANGGEEALKKYTAAKATLKGTMQIMGMELEISGEDVYQIPGMTKSTIKVEVGGQKVNLTQVYNNGRVKMTANGKEIPVSDAVKDEMKQESNLQMASQYVPLLDEKKFEVTVIEKPENVNEKAVVGLLIKSKGLKEIKMFFDAKSYLCVKVVRRGLNPQEKEVNQEVFFNAYKKAKGMSYPSKTTVLLDGKKYLETEVVSYEPLEKIDKSEFDVSD